MIKSIFAAGALLAAATSVSQVEFSGSGLSVAGKAVTEESLQLREAGDNTVLASHNKVESLGGILEVAIGDGRMVTIEPGVRLSRVGNAWEISGHGRRPLRLASGNASISVASPASVSPVDGGWRLNNGTMVEGSDLRASLIADGDVRRVAEGFAVPPDGVEEKGEEAVLTPKQKAELEKEKASKKLRQRRVLKHDIWPGAEAADEQALKRVVDVSPSGF